VFAVAVDFAVAVAVSSPCGRRVSRRLPAHGGFGRQWRGAGRHREDVAWRDGRYCRGMAGTLARRAALAAIGLGLVAGYERRETPPFNSKRRLRRSV
jgi:hypothetical protein